MSVFDLLCLALTVDLPLYFPRDQPTLTFQSVYHFTNSGQLYSQVQKSYPYSPRWDGNEMAKRAKWVDQWSYLNDSSEFSSIKPIELKVHAHVAFDGADVQTTN